MNDCIIATQAAERSGYARTYLNGKREGVHRIAWIKVNGPIPAGMTIDHLCEVKLCINVTHMEVVSRGENARRWWLKHFACPHGSGLARGACRDCLKAQWTAKNRRDGHRPRPVCPHDSALRSKCRPCINALSRESANRRRENHRAQAE